MKSAKDYIATNDFKGAKERFDKANKGWKAHWFNTCVEIFDTCKDWAKEYIIDPINKTITAIKETIKKTVPKTLTTSHTYLIKMFDKNGEWVFTKIGKANDISKRIKDFINHHYSRQNITIADVEIIKEYEVPNDDLAQVLESFMRNHFRKSHELIPNDRFAAFEPTDEDLNEFERYYNLVLASTSI